MVKDSENFMVMSHSLVCTPSEVLIQVCFISRPYTLSRLADLLKSKVIV